MARQNDFDLTGTQRHAWLEQAAILQTLLTRARQGMVVVVPRGDDAGPTRLPAFYDETFDDLAGCGMSIISS